MTEDLDARRGTVTTEDDGRKRGDEKSHGASLAFPGGRSIRSADHPPPGSITRIRVSGVVGFLRPSSASIPVEQERPLGPIFSGSPGSAGPWLC